MFIKRLSCRHKRCILCTDVAACVSLSGENRLHSWGGMEEIESHLHSSASFSRFGVMAVEGEGRGGGERGRGRGGRPFV